MIIIENKDLPNDWHWVSLEEICETTSGGTPSRKILSYYDGDIPWVKSGELNDCLIYDAEEKITEQAIKNSSAKIFPPETLLIALYGATVGKLGILKISAATNQAVCAIFDSKYVNRDYLYFYLLSQRKKLIEISSGGAQPNISQEIIRRLKIPLPPLVEQKRIAAIAQKADRLRRTRRYALQLSDTYVPSVFLEMFGDPATNPNEWEITRLGDLLDTSPQNGLYVQKENYENGSSNNSVEMVHMSDLFYGIVRRGNLKRVNISAADIKKYSIGYNDLLVARRSLMYEGAAKPCLIPESNAPLVFESSIIRVTVNKFKLLPVYLYYYLSNERARFAHVLRYVTESTISGINQNGLSNIEIIQPPLPLQEKFAQIVQKFDRLRTQQREADRQAEHLFQTLLHRAFRGELTSQHADDEPESVLLEEIRAQQAKAEAKAKTATQAMGDAADYLGTKAKQQDIEPIQLKFPGFE